ncbi:hypothetical protein [Pseudoalteromonas shioyasakiensis]|uniref:hypothetical protein n=1 Tax=Pseudoalteromonas shioyasakiensis TaxID=1190813 RepID=UPI001C3C6510|nr:hypothetical protein [Pseudoalteromonas shioyasakiensis]
MKLKRHISNYIYLTLLISIPSYGNEQQTVWLEGDTIYYESSLSKESNDALFKLYVENNKVVDKISIKSKGGEINLGLDLGNFIFDKNLNVEVTSYCLSSCANYVFTAGRIKYVEGDAVIGFHGGASSMEFDMSELDALSDSAREKAKEQFNNYLAQAAIREQTFFKKIGVNQRITTYGQDHKYADLEQQNFGGWYYPKESLNKLGVQNIVVNAPAWKPKQLSENVKLFEVNVVGI